MASRIISFKTNISNAGRAKLTITTEDGIQSTVAFEQNNIGHFAAVCALLDHTIVEFEMVGDVPHFKSKKP